MPAVMPVLAARTSPARKAPPVPPVTVTVLVPLVPVVVLVTLLLMEKMVVPAAIPFPETGMPTAKTPAGSTAKVSVLPPVAPTPAKFCTFTFAMRVFAAMPVPVTNCPGTKLVTLSAVSVFALVDPPGPALVPVKLLIEPKVLTAFSSERVPPPDFKRLPLPVTAPLRRSPESRLESLALLT